MHIRTKALHLRIPGHWWDEELAEHFEGLLANGYESHYGVYDYNGLHDRNATSNYLPGVVSPITGLQHSTPWSQWRAKTLTHVLNELFADLDNFTMLESIIFEAWPEIRRRIPFVCASTVRSLCQHLPVAHNLTAMTIDIAGFDSIRTGGNSHDGCPSGVCGAVGRVWPRVKNVRI
ncbi:hypothetical protein LTR62_001800 [Meristemomyces frigidus]|uniref:Uncharacterized protein n=1 Tax=Meristemomyces frigidus TaxID=1508187 RepID=A0AAN7TGE9_9PEZI|nr:hypothetical protein LTR62_001800 [Meristemomyces frigidus]